MFYFYTFIYSLKSCFKPEFPSSAKQTLFWRRWKTKQLLVHSVWLPTNNCLVTHLLQNIFLLMWIVRERIVIEPPGQVVQWQQSLSECGEDEGDCRWLQESALSACSSDHQRCDRGESEQHQVPGCTHHRGPLLDQQHCSTSQESTTASLLPPLTQKSQSPGPHHVHLLQRHHWEHSD